MIFEYFSSYISGEICYICAMKLMDDSQKISIFYHCDLQLESMTLIVKVDLHMMKMYLCDN